MNRHEIVEPKHSGEPVVEIREGAWRLRYLASAEAELRDEGVLSPESVIEAPLDIVKAAVVGKEIGTWRPKEGTQTRAEVTVPFGDEFPRYFVKRRCGIRLSERVKKRWAAEASTLGEEWRALRHARALGVLAPEPLVVAERQGPAGVSTGFLVTRALPKAETLESIAASGCSASRRARIIGELAEVLACLHAGGLNHRDFYLGHLRADAEDRLQVLDLDRAQIRSKVPERWRVKDLAALQVSAAPAWATDRERLRLLVGYEKGLRRRASGEASVRALMVSVETKAQTMRAHIQRKIARGDANIHLNE